MQKWLLVVQATAEIEERWIVEAATQADAEDHFCGGVCLSDRTLGEERDREVDSIAMLDDDQAAGLIAAERLPDAAPALLAALEDWRDHHDDPNMPVAELMARTLAAIASAKGAA